MPPDHPGLTEDEVITGGGWHPRYTRVLAIASDGDHAFALVDGNGDGAELEAELWTWDAGAWTGGVSSGAGPFDALGPVQTIWRNDNAYTAFGKAPGRQAVTIDFDHHLHQVPVSRHGVWAFIKTSTSPGNPGFPTPTA
jgi:hypothetical protein